MIDAKGRDHPHDKIRPTKDHTPQTKPEIVLARRTPYFQTTRNLQCLQTSSHPELTLSTRIRARREWKHGHEVLLGSRVIDSGVIHPAKVDTEDNLARVLVTSSPRQLFITWLV